MRVFTFAAILAAAFSAAPAVAGSPSHYAILPVSQGRAVLDQCSRESPEYVTEFWRPSAAEIESAERALPAFLGACGHKIVLHQFFRQYIGVVLRGRRLIYLNAFPYPAPGTSEAANARTKAYVYCDGGELFWGAEFDPATKNFRNLAFNGVA